MKFFITHNYYGGDVNIIEQAARECNAQLIAVRGYALEDFPGPRDYVEGDAQYIFQLERDTPEEAGQVVIFQIRERVRELFLISDYAEQLNAIIQQVPDRYIAASQNGFEAAGLGLPFRFYFLEDYNRNDEKRYRLTCAERTEHDGPRKRYTWMGKTIADVLSQAAKENKFNPDAAPPYEWGEPSTLTWESKK